MLSSIVSWAAYGPSSKALGLDVVHNFPNKSIDWNQTLKDYAKTCHQIIGKILIIEAELNVLKSKRFLQINLGLW